MSRSVPAVKKHSGVITRTRNWVTGLRWMAGKVLRHGWPRRVFMAGGGIGDHLLLTAVFRELRRRGERGLWLLSDYPELFENNRAFDAVLPLTADNWWYLVRMGRRLEQASYGLDMAATHDRSIPPPPGRHIISCFCQSAGISGPIMLKPDFYLKPEEARGGRLAANQIAVQNSGKGGKYAMATKEWFPERMQEVVSRLGSKYTFVHIGKEVDPPLAGAIDLRGKTNLRQTAAILAGSKLFVGLVGFPMHLARAVNTRSVIVYGGREGPEQSGYRCNLNLFTQLDCSRCWRHHSSVNDMECMRRISADDVVAAIERHITLTGKPIEAEVDIVPAGPLCISDADAEAAP